ncbi:cytochrome P450 family protein [Ceratobasidium sp. AG-Ba]|nr:cytochrome P450 family protein [Ceratobasidium sp. AG-Ba]
MDNVRGFEYLGPFIFGLSLVAISRSCYLWVLPKPIPGIPHDPVTSILGHIPDIVRFSKNGEKDISKWFNSMSTKYGALSQVLLGRVRTVIVADRAEVERLLLKGKSTEQSGWIRDSFSTIIPTGQLALPTGDMWKRHRQLAGPSMSRLYIKQMSTHVSAAANSLVQLWSLKLDLVGNKAFAADRDLKLAVLSKIVNITMGDAPSSIEVALASLPKSRSSLCADDEIARIPQADSPPLQKAINNLMQSVQSLNFAPLPVYISRIFIQDLSPTWRKSRNTVSEFINQKIVEARARESSAPKLKQGVALATDADCVVDMVAQREAREGVEKFDIGELRDELFTFILAGQDTTGVVLSWLVKFLPQDMDVQRRLHNEVCSLFGSDSDGMDIWDFDLITDSERVPILEAVVAESLRCAVLAPHTMRELTEDEVILGRHVPKGAQLMLALGLLSTQETDWGPDAKTWRPSRWLKADGSFDVNAGPNFPFGIGQRACFGQRLAMLKLKTFVAALSRAFVFNQVPDHVAGLEAFVKVSRQPEHCYVSLERWPVD